ncbi:MAG: type II secretion system protein N [Gammaproteobacteria bacterium]|nr:type II secretion system protein N [Gammaproteobacteria bacterium]
MKVRSRLITAGLVTFVVALIVFFPARVAYRWLAPDGIALAGISGSLWNGGALEGQANGIYLRDIAWRVQPLKLFTGKLGFSIEAAPPSGFVDANVAVGIGGTVTLTGVKASLTLQSLQTIVRMPGLRGNVNAQFDRLIIDSGLPVAADGVVEVADLVAPAVNQASIGGYRAEFFTQESGVMASVEDTDGVIDLAGSLQISSDRSYQFIAQLAPKDNTPASVRQQMQFLGSANERGQHQMRLEGQL